VSLSHRLFLNAATWKGACSQATNAEGGKELKRKNMKNLINLFIDDIKNENLSRQEIIRYGVIAPLVFYILFLIEQIINAL
jgi:hypothetical protein